MKTFSINHGLDDLEVAIHVERDENSGETAVSLVNDTDEGWAHYVDLSVSWMQLLPGARQLIPPNHFLFRDCVECRGLLEQLKQIGIIEVISLTIGVPKWGDLPVCRLTERAKVVTV